MPRVYVVNRGPHDYSGAERFGELTFCTEGSIDKYDLAQMHREVSEALADSEPCDYLLLTSLTSLCSVACAIFATKHKRLNILLHRADGYVERTILFNNSTRNSNAKRSALTK